MRYLSLVILFVVTALPLGAHEMRPVYLEITELSPETYEGHLESAGSRR
jgi:hypothetical protein